MTRLTSTLHPFTWTQEAEAAFARLKGLFTTVPILCQPDPAWQFVVEVDAEDSSSWSWCWLSRSGTTGWRGRLYLFWSGLTMKTWPISGGGQVSQLPVSKLGPVPGPVLVHLDLLAGFKER